MVGLRQWIWSDASVSLSFIRSGVKVIVRKRSQHTQLTAQASGRSRATCFASGCASGMTRCSGRLGNRAARPSGQLNQNRLRT
eukprot:9407539-Heterocapsa_arctica.AAC.1